MQCCLPPKQVSLAMRILVSLESIPSMETWVRLGLPHCTGGTSPCSLWLLLHPCSTLAPVPCVFQPTPLRLTVSTDLLAPKRFWMGKGGKQDLLVPEEVWAVAPASVNHGNNICFGMAVSPLGILPSTVGVLLPGAGCPSGCLGGQRVSVL